jgi:N-carbamoylputrescine amidase
MRQVSMAITQMASENNWSKNCDKAEMLVREAESAGAQLVLV